MPEYQDMFEASVLQIYQMTVAELVPGSRCSDRLETSRHRYTDSGYAVVRLSNSLSVAEIDFVVAKSPIDEPIAWPPLIKQSQC